MFFPAYADVFNTHEAAKILGTSYQKVCKYLKRFHFKKMGGDGRGHVYRLTKVQIEKLEVDMRR